MAGVEVVGARELRRALRTLPKEYRRELAAIHKKAVKPVVDTAKVIAPRRSGRLAGSIRALGSQTQGQVAVGKKSVPYAGVIHYGWAERNIAAQPFLEDALDRRQNAVLVIWVKNQNRLLDKVWRAAGVR